MTHDRSDARVVTYRVRGVWHQHRYEPNHDGTWTRIHRTRHAHGDSWRTRGMETVAELDIDTESEADLPLGESRTGP